MLRRFRELTAGSWWFEEGPLLIIGNGEARLFGGGLLVPAKEVSTLAHLTFSSSPSFNAMEVKISGWLRTRLRSKW